MVNHHFEHGILIQLNQLTTHKFNIDTKKWPYLKGTTFYKPSFWISMLVFGGWKHLTNNWIHILVQPPGPWRSFNAWLISSLQVCLTPSLKYRLFTRDLRNSMEGSFKNHQKSNLSLYNCNHVCMHRQLHKTLHCTRMRHIVDPGIAGQFKEGSPFGCIRQVFAHRLQESPT